MVNLKCSENVLYIEINLPNGLSSMKSLAKLAKLDDTDISLCVVIVDGHGDRSSVSILSIFEMSTSTEPTSRFPFIYF